MLLAVSLVAAFLLVKVGTIVGSLIIILLCGVMLILSMMKDYKIGIYTIFLMCVFMPFFNRMMGTHIQYGVMLDALAVLTFVIMLFRMNEPNSNWHLLKSPITYLYITIVVYQLLQLFNPNAVSFLGWGVAMRGNTSFLLFFVFFNLFVSFQQIKNFTYVWIGLAAIIAFYGIYQEAFGLNSKEMAWVYADPIRIKLLLIWGQMRKFSLLSDPSIFGLFMAFSGLACLALMLGPFSVLQRILYGVLASAMFIAMSFSGTRTAIAMVVVGIALYMLITLRNRKTFFGMIAVALVGLVILFGPFYGGTLSRIRTTFKVGEDASMSVRDYKRLRFQEYIQDHPFGGGLNTMGANGLKYSAGHYLADGTDPDSGYLLTALELGWLGLIIGLAFFFAVMLKGINNYFALDDPLLKTLTLAYIVPFFALSLAHFTQDAMFQKPVYLIVIATYALMLRLPSFDNKNLINT